MTVIWTLLTGVTLAITVSVIIIGNLFRLWYFLKCFKIRECSERACRYRQHCSKYHEKLTHEDRKRIAELIDEISNNSG